MEHRAAAHEPISVYREFAPTPALRRYVRALAWYGPAEEAVQGANARRPVREFYLGSDCALSPTFADAQTSLLFPLEWSFDGITWRHCIAATGATGAAPGAMVMGPVTRATQPSPERFAMIGVYFRPLGTAQLLPFPAAELSDRTLPLGELWNGFGAVSDRPDLASVEALLLQKLSVRASDERAVRTAELASYVLGCGGNVSVRQMAYLVGLSRQHLGRSFLEHVGVAPKLYARLARFRSALRHVRHRPSVGGWSALAAHLGYADQSHLIADFREFTSFTPEPLARGERFHPFIGDHTDG